MNLSKKVIILDKINSQSIAQAIFILKDDAPCEFSALYEAEKIVSDYMADPSNFESKKSVLPFLLLGLFITGVVLAAIFSL